MTRAVDKFVKLMATDEGQDILKAFEHQANSVWDSGRRRYGTQTILAVLDDKIAYSLHQSYLWEYSSWRQIGTVRTEEGDLGERYHLPPS